MRSCLPYVKARLCAPATLFELALTSPPFFFFFFSSLFAIPTSSAGHLWIETDCQSTAHCPSSRRGLRKRVQWYHCTLLLLRRSCRFSHGRSKRSMWLCANCRVTRLLDSYKLDNDQRLSQRFEEARTTLYVASPAKVCSFFSHENSRDPVWLFAQSAVSQDYRTAKSVMMIKECRRGLKRRVHCMLLLLRRRSQRVEEAYSFSCKEDRRDLRKRICTTLYGRFSCEGLLVFPHGNSRGPVWLCAEAHCHKIIVLRTSGMMIRG
jgi:hypothetical protein